MTNKTDLVGKFFHTLGNSSEYGLGAQGTIIEDQGDGKYLCQLFGWGTGNPFVEKDEFNTSEMQKWSFYKSRAEMEEASDLFFLINHAQHIIDHASL